MIRRAAATMMAATTVAGIVTAQQRPTFRTEINYVELHVSVTTKDGQHVHGLTRADFAVRESGAVQEIGTVDEISLPMPAPKDAHAPEPDGSVADTGLLGDGRLYVIVIDRPHLDFGNVPKLSRQLAQFVDDFITPSDQVAVINLGSSRVTPFTTNKARLRAGLGIARGSRTGSDSADVSSPVGSGRMEAAVADSVTANREQFEAAETERNATATAGNFDTMDALAKYLRGFEGRRKALIYVSGGVNVIPPNSVAEPSVTGSQSAVSNAFARMVSSLQASNITVYTIDPNGLATFNPYDGGGSATPLSDKYGPDYVAPVAMVRSIADDTGGFPVVGYNDLTKPFARIVEDNSHYYVIGYSSNRPADGKVHDIKVQVVGRDVDVRVRGEIEAASPKAKPEPVDTAWRKTDIVSLLARPVPTADPGLRVRVTASAVSWHGGKATVQLALEVHEGGLMLKPDGGFWTDNVTAAFQMIDENGAVKAARSEIVSLRVRPETRDAIRDRGWRYLAEFDVPRGVYQLRTAVSETGAGRSGSAFLDLPIVDAGKAPLSVAGLALASETARTVPSAGAAPTIRKAVESVVTASRVFPPSETVTALAAIVDNIAGDHDASITATLVASDGTVAKQVSRTSSSKDVRQNAPPRAIPLSLAGIPAGDYMLVVKVDAAGKSARRSVVLQVRK